MSKKEALEKALDKMLDSPKTKIKKQKRGKKFDRHELKDSLWDVVHDFPYDDIKYRSRKNLLTQPKKS